MLRRLVSDSAQCGTGASQVLIVHGLIMFADATAGRAGAQRDLGQTEIEYLSVTALGDINIRRFGVAMHDPLRLGPVVREMNNCRVASL